MLELAQSKDWETVNRLAGQVHVMHVSWRPDIYEMEGQRYPQERFQECIKERQLYVARIEEITVGYVLVRIRETGGSGLVKRRVMLLEELCVDEKFHRRGIGTGMMMDVKALGKAFGCTDIQLSVYPQNDGAVAFYQKAGLMIQSINMQMKL